MFVENCYSATVPLEFFLNGADFVVMGSQMTKGNPDNGVSAVESRRLMAEEIKKVRFDVLDKIAEAEKNFGSMRAFIDDGA